MFTVMLLLFGFVVGAVLVAIVTGLIAISPLLLVIIALPFLDYFVIRGLLRRRKSKKK